MKLEPGEVICPVCKGESKIFCFKCGGTGKIDWIDLCMNRNIFGTFTITLPKIRKMYPKLIAKELVSVQPIDWGEKNET